ncbi:hypothetical protein V8F20_006666 [Naviculisporaceae sp. PSN 640]
MPRQKREPKPAIKPRPLLPKAPGAARDGAWSYKPTANDIAFSGRVGVITEIPASHPAFNHSAATSNATDLSAPLVQTGPLRANTSALPAPLEHTGPLGANTSAPSAPLKQARSLGVPGEPHVAVQYHGGAEGHVPAGRVEPTTNSTTNIPLTFGNPEFKQHITAGRPEPTINSTPNPKLTFGNAGLNQHVAAGRAKRPRLTGNLTPNIAPTFGNTGMNQQVYVTARQHVQVAAGQAEPTIHLTPNIPLSLGSAGLKQHYHVTAGQAEPTVNTTANIAGQAELTSNTTPNIPLPFGNTGLKQHVHVAAGQVKPTIKTTVNIPLPFEDSGLKQHAHVATGRAEPTFNSTTNIPLTLGTAGLEQHAHISTGQAKPIINSTPNVPLPFGNAESGIAVNPMADAGQHATTAWTDNTIISVSNMPVTSGEDPGLSGAPPPQDHRTDFNLGTEEDQLDQWTNGSRELPAGAWGNTDVDLTMRRHDLSEQAVRAEYRVIEQNAMDPTNDPRFQNPFMGLTEEEEDEFIAYAKSLQQDEGKGKRKANDISD